MMMAMSLSAQAIPLAKEQELKSSINYFGVAIALAISTKQQCARIEKMGCQSVELNVSSLAMSTPSRGSSSRRPTPGR